jgi:hypothetical protein
MAISSAGRAIGRSRVVRVQPLDRRDRLMAMNFHDGPT